MSFAADRSGAWVTLVMFTFRPVLTVLLTVSLGFLVTAVLAGDIVESVVAAIGACLALVAQIASARYSLNISATMIDRTSKLVDIEMQRALHGTSTIEHLLDQKMLDRLHLIRAEKARLTEGADVTGLIIGTFLRIALTVLIAAVATPWLLLVPVAALIAYACSQRAATARERARTAAAESARHQEMFVRTAMHPGHRDELVLSTGTKYIRSSHALIASLAEGLRAHGAWVAFCWSMAGALTTSCAMAIGAWALAGAVTTGAANAGTYVSALLLLSSTTSLLNAAVRYVGSLSESLRLTQTYRSIVDVLQPAARLPGERGDSKLHSVELAQVSYTYPAAVQPAIDNLTLSLKAGRVYAVVGQNGSGKSTLVNLLTGMLTENSGMLEFRYEDGSTHRRARRVSMVAQDFARLEFTLEDAVRLGRPLVSSSLRAATDESGVTASAMTLSTSLGGSLPNGKQPSGGQWQRVALARGLYCQNPDLLVLDEPTSAIDPLAEDALLTQFVRRSARVARDSGGVALIVTHRMSLVQDVDAVIFVEAGRVAAVGTHDELLHQPTYRMLYEAQSKHYLTNAGKGSEDD